MDLTRLLNSVGQKTFVDFYHLFDDESLTNKEVAALLPARFTEKARNSKTGHARKILREGMGVDALRRIATSTRAGNEAAVKGALGLLEELGKSA